MHRIDFSCLCEVTLQATATRGRLTENQLIKIVFYLRLGVSIGLDVISIEISISTPKKYQSRRSRKSRRFSKVSLDVMDNLDRDRDFSILSR